MRPLILAAALLTATPALAQQPAPRPSAESALAGALAQNLSAALAENDALRAQITALEKQIAATKPKPSEPKH